MKMICQTSDSFEILEWKMQRNLSSKPEIIYSKWRNVNKVVNSHFGIDNKGNIYVNATELDDAGIYICVARLGKTQQPCQYSAQLIVFGTKPNCSISQTTDDDQLSQGGSYFVTIHCFVKFRGFWPPTIEWRLHNANGEADLQGRVIAQGVDTIRPIFPDTSITSTLINTINATKYGHFYSCSFHFSAENYYSRLTNDTNIPEFNYIWNSSLVGMLKNESTNYTQDFTVGYGNEYSIYTYLVAAIIIVGITFIAIYLIASIKRRTTVGQPPDLAANLSNGHNPVLETRYVAHGSGRAYIGNDGTEYMQMNTLGGQPASIELPTNNSGMFSLVEVYASIDHNFRIQPPPPPQKRF